MFYKTPKRQVQDLIRLDIKYNYTPDLPYLRFTGKFGIPVFLWDDLRDFKQLATICSTGYANFLKHYSSKYMLAVSKDKYAAWYNMSSSSSYQAFMLDDAQALPYLDMPDYSIDDGPHRIEGKIANISLRLLTELDMYYENTKAFTRKKIKVHPSVYSEELIECYTWMNDISQLGNWDVDTQSYKLKSTIDLAPLSKSTRFKEDIYEM